jgi:hypothetical protein
MKKIFLLMIIALFLISAISFGSAVVQTLPPVHSGDCIVIPQTCGNCTFVNITKLYYPNHTIILSDVAMNKSKYSYTYTFCETETIGNYIVEGVGNPGGAIVPFTYDFQVTYTGALQTTAQGLGSLGFIFLMVALTALFGWIGFKLSSSPTLWIMGIFMLFLSTLFVIYDVWLGYEYHRALTGAADSGVPEIIFYVFLMLFVAGFLTALGLLFLRWKEVFRYIKNEVKKKPEDNDEEFNLGIEE